MRASAVFAAMLLVAPFAAPADANGRFPATNGIHFQPGDLHSLYVQSTFGMLVSHDDGCTFSWVCEQNVGFGGTFDPIYRIGSDGTIYAATLFGLAISRDGGCSFTTSTLGSGSSASGVGQYLAALDISATGEVWVGQADTGVVDALYASSDAGATFQAKLQSTTELYRSVVPAPSLPTRIYATSYALGSGSAGSGADTTLYRSDDDGSNWTTLPLPGIALGSTPLVEVFAVHPTTPDTVFVSSVGANPPIGDILYRSLDGGQTFSDVLHTPTAIHDVTFTDASHVYVALDPTEDDSGTLTPAPAFAASDGGSAFAMMTGAPELECLAAREDGVLFGCGQNWIDSKAIAQLQTSGAWSDVFQFYQLAGPLSCPTGSLEQSQCDSQWPALQQQFSTTGPVCGSDAGSGGLDAGMMPPPQPPPGGGCTTSGTGPLSLLCAIGAAAIIIRSPPALTLYGTGRAGYSGGR